MRLEIGFDSSKCTTPQDEGRFSGSDNLLSNGYRALLSRVKVAGL
jgi:hypothetical protein